MISVLMFVTISLATAINIDKNKEEKKVTPLFNIRAINAINKEKYKEIRDKIITRFFGNRVFFIPRIFTKIRDVIAENTPTYWRTCKDVTFNCLTCGITTCQDSCDINTYCAPKCPVNINEDGSGITVGYITACPSSCYTNCGKCD